MIEIEDSKNKKLTTDEINDVYDMEDLFDRRREELIKGRFIEKASSEYVNTKKGEFMARIGYFLKTYLQLGDGG